MHTIDGPAGLGGAADRPAPPPPAPQVGLRLVTTYAGATRRIDLGLRGSEGVLVENGVATPFRTERLWPVVRDLLPPLEHLRADPPSRRTGPGGPPGPGFAEQCRAMVVLATVVGDAASGADDPGADDPAGTHVAVRTWLATDDDLWSVAAHADGSTEVRAAEPGALADLLVWDVTAALEALVRMLEAAS